MILVLPFTFILALAIFIGNGKRVEREQDCETLDKLRLQWRLRVDITAQNRKRNYMETAFSKKPSSARCMRILLWRSFVVV